MFGLFKKKYTIECALCSAKYEIKINKSDYTKFDYENSDYRELVEQLQCEFCKTDLAITFNKKEKVEVWDEKWEILRNENDDKISEIMDKISDFKDELEDNPDDKNTQKAIEKLEEKQSKIEEAFEKKEEKYYDRQERLQEKWQDKYDKYLDKK